MGPILFIDVLRGLSALVFKEISGSPLIVALARVHETLVGRRHQPRDLTVLPLTRAAFWARLGRPDKLVRGEDGAWNVSALLPHVDWERGHSVRMGDDFWNVSPLPAEYQGGRLTHRYRLVSLAEPGDEARGVPAPDPFCYQRSVRERVTREWDGLESSFVFRGLVSMLPVAAQKRALEGRDVLRARAASRTTCGLTALLGIWFVTGAGAFNVLAGIVLFGDAVQRLPRVLAGEPAPSWFGRLFSDYLPPERDEYVRHRDAERSVLSGIG